MKLEIAISEQGVRIIDRFIHELKTHHQLSPRTLKEYASDLRHFIGWFEWTRSAGCSGSQALFDWKEVTTPSLMDYRKAMQEEMGLKPATINRRLVTLKRFFDWAVSGSGQIEDPSKPVKLVPERKTCPRKMTDEEEAALLTVTEKHGSRRDHTLVFLMLHTGLRPMEICALTPGDFAGDKHGSYIKVRSGPRNKSRQVPLDASSKELVNHYMTELSPQALYLFPSEKTGDRLTERALRHLIQKYMKAAGMTGLCAQDLRHRFGYVMAVSTPLHRLAEMMGHERLTTTMVYAKTEHPDHPVKQKVSGE